MGGPTAPSSRTVESHICRLRRRLTEAGATDTINNCWGRGYSLLNPMRAGQES